MKKIIGIVSMMIMCVVAVAQDYPISTIIGTNSVVILPDRRNDQAIPNVWVYSNVVAQGDQVLSTNNQIYWAVTAGTTTNAPNTLTADFTDDAVTWRHIPTGVELRPIPRESLTIMSLSTNDIFFGDGFTAVTNKGKVITGIGGGLITDSQFKQYAISGQTNNTIIIQDR